jgi:hypothetical protein
MHANGALGQAGGMGGGIYATGQAGHDDQARFCKTGLPADGPSAFSRRRHCAPPRPPHRGA